MGLIGASCGGRQRPQAPGAAAARPGGGPCRNNGILMQRPRGAAAVQAALASILSGSSESGAGLAIRTATSCMPAADDEERIPPIPRLRQGSKATRCPRHQCHVRPCA
ncbi:hypothetical protein NDU88_006144 [Pleurodeles waltl]|uniref:Uncharacterized protein n=1 Tax=Pleurodeles waltl TaxID=8319 RepID=A0AAV7SNP3_PLEWA|nr:hypothetical protein NDU88_006144 [Pleurodeles waltl]